jgi:hypothetical protein
MLNWLSGLRRFGLLCVVGCAATIAPLGLVHAQSFAVMNLTNNTASAASYPNMVVDGNGNIYLAWVDTIKGLVVFSKFDGTKFNSQTTVSSSAAVLPAFQPQMAVYVNSGTGPNVEIVWAALHPGSNPPTYDVYASRSNDGGANFSAPILVSAITGPAPLADSPRAAFDTSGRVNVVWGQTGVWISQSMDGINFGSPISLLPVTNPPTLPPNTGGPRVAADVSGNIYVAWTDVAGANAPGSYCLGPAPGAIETATSGGNFWMNETLATTPPSLPSPANTRNLSNNDWKGPSTRFPNGFFGCSFDNLSLFVDGTGRMHLLWSDETPDEDILTSKTESTYPAGSPFAGDVVFSFPINLATYAAASPEVAVDSKGSFYVVWSGGPTGGSNSEGIFFSRSDDGGGTFTTEVNVAPSGSISPAYPQVAVDSNSNVNVVWEQPTKAIAGNGSDMFNVVFAHSTDRGATFPTVSQVSNNASQLCFTATNPVQTTPNNTTCGIVQLGVGSTSTPSIAWVSQASGAAVADIDLATPAGSVSPTSASLSAASPSATFTLAVNPSAFSGSVTFSCVDADTGGALPAWLSCNFNPQQINTAQTTSDSLTINRTATPTSSILLGPPSSRSLPAFGLPMAWTMALATLSLIAMALLIVSRRRELSGAVLMRGLLVMTLTIVLAAGLVSCGGSTSNGTTSSGTNGNGGTTGGSGGGTGGSGGTGGGNSVTAHVAVLAQSGSTAPMNLGTVTITAQ